MKNIFAKLLLATSVFFSTAAVADSGHHHHSHPEFAYVYLTDDQTVCSGQAINWCEAGTVNTDDIFVSSSDPHQIILKKRGYYLVTFTLTGGTSFNIGTDKTDSTQACATQSQFSLFLNNCENPIPGSTYGSAGIPFFPTTASGVGPINPPTEIVGQVIFRVNERDSTLELRNTCFTEVGLVDFICQGPNQPSVQTDGGNRNCTSNVPASLAIQRLSNLDID